jgi:polyhydroxybutyrate depolymerase
MQTTALPQTVSDGTSVALTTFTACPADAAAWLYTINGGGHTWPGSLDGAWTAALGRTTGNLDATIALWTFLSQYQLN